MPITSYEEFPGFHAVYLEDSYVLKILTTQSSAEFDLNVVLTEDHPLYSPPGPSEQYCMRNARMRFVEASTVKWLEVSIRPSVDADGVVDLGNIDVMYLKDGEYHVAGEWGELRIVSSPPVIDGIQDR